LNSVDETTDSNGVITRSCTELEAQIVKVFKYDIVTLYAQNYDWKEEYEAFYEKVSRLSVSRFEVGDISQSETILVLTEYPE
jgi:hypothetical protein